MFLTETEILDTPNSLKQTCRYFDQRKAEIDAFFASHTQRKFLFLGCGSSFMLAKSGAAVFAALPDTESYALAAGDYILAPETYREMLQDSIIIALSRSGRTSEMIWAVKDMRSQSMCPVIAVTAEENSDLSPISDLDLPHTWCYDRSVCQTRTVTNLYTAMLLLAAAYGKNAMLYQSILSAVWDSEALHASHSDELKSIAALPWDNAVVLADGPVCGIAEEGALAFTEIAMMTGRYSHLLDYRHGPIVISGENTLTLVLLRPGEESLQAAMVRDIIAHGGTVVTVSQQSGNPHNAALHVQIGSYHHFAAAGIPFIGIIQHLALQKSLALGGNPDQPKGLNAYIAL